MPVKIRHFGNFNNLERFLNVVTGKKYLNNAEKVGQAGVASLESQTPKRTGKTAASWTYEIENKGKSTAVVWSNTNTNNGENVALLLQYGHGTGTGGYVPGNDYINPAMEPILDSAVDEVWKEVTS